MLKQARGEGEWNGVKNEMTLTRGKVLKKGAKIMCRMLLMLAMEVQSSSFSL